MNGRARTARPALECHALLGGHERKGMRGSRIQRLANHHARLRPGVRGLQGPYFCHDLPVTFEPPIDKTKRVGGAPHVGARAGEDERIGCAIKRRATAFADGADVTG